MKPGWTFVLLCTLCWSHTGLAQSSVSAVVINAYDGDTLSVKADIWPDLTHSGNVRVRGVDTPEIRGQCEQERELAIAARDYVRYLLVDQSITLTELENDLYGGRVLAKVHLSTGENLADLLIEKGYGRAYDGAGRENWCDEPIEIPASSWAGHDDSTPEGSSPQASDPPSPEGEDPLALYDDNGNGRITCAEARKHGIAPVHSDHAAYAYMSDRDGDGVVCE